METKYLEVTDANGVMAPIYFTREGLLELSSAALTLANSFPVEEEKPKKKTKIAAE